MIEYVIKAIGCQFVVSGTLLPYAKCIQIMKERRNQYLVSNGIVAILH